MTFVMFTKQLFKGREFPTYNIILMVLKTMEKITTSHTIFDTVIFLDDCAAKLNEI